MFNLYPQKGALTGLICGLAFAFWIGIGAQVYKPITEKPPLFAFDNCTDNDMNYTTTMMMSTTMDYNMTTALPVER